MQNFSFFHFPLFGEFFVVTILFLHDFTKQYECPDRDRFTIRFKIFILIFDKRNIQQEFNPSTDFS